MSPHVLKPAGTKIFQMLQAGCHIFQGVIVKSAIYHYIPTDINTFMKTSKMCFYVCYLKFIFTQNRHQKPGQEHKQANKRPQPQTHM